MEEKTNGYDFSRNWFDWCFENPELISPNHSAIYFFAIEHCNRLGWKKKFGFPTQMAMDAIGIKKHETYIRYFNDLVKWGFFILIQKSTNQYSSNIISIGSAIIKNGKALGKAILKHEGKQIESIGESNSSINKLNNQETIKPINENLPKNLDFVCGFDDMKNYLHNETIIEAESFCMKYSTTTEIFYTTLDKFLNDLQIKKDLDRTVADTWKYFINWFVKQLENKKPEVKKEGNFYINQNGKKVERTYQ